MTTTHDILDRAGRFDRTFKTQADYAHHVYLAIQAAGYWPVPAQYDDAGNCVFCGEAGRCPGWHTTDEVK